MEGKKMKAIYFDMDGTIADFYGVAGWLESLQERNVSPYLLAKPMFNAWQFSILLNGLKRKGYHIGIISWTAKNSNEDFNRKIEKAKRHWLKENLFINLDEIKIVPYGTPKSEAVDFPFGILFDDEKPNRENWLGNAYTPAEITEILEAL